MISHTNCKLMWIKSFSSDFSDNYKIKHYLYPDKSTIATMLIVVALCIVAPLSKRAFSSW